MNKPRTLEEIYKEVGKFPFRIKNEYWDESHWCELVGQSTIGKKDFIGFWQDGTVCGWGTDVSNWILVQPEKKKVVRWLWTDKEGQISRELASEKEAKNFYEEYPIKLEWSKTVFEVE